MNDNTSDEIRDCTTVDHKRLNTAAGGGGGGDAKHLATAAATDALLLHRQLAQQSTRLPHTAQTEQMCQHKQ